MSLSTLFREPVYRFKQLVLSCLAIVILAVAFGACSGSDKPVETTSSNATGNGTALPSAGPNEGNLEQLMSKYVAGVDGSVTYAVDSDNFGVHPKGTWSTYRMGKAIREDWTTNTYGYDETNIAINTGDTFVFCSKTE